MPEAELQIRVVTRRHRQPAIKGFLSYRIQFFQARVALHVREHGTREMTCAIKSRDSRASDVYTVG
jgi:hypothetical protein